MVSSETASVDSNITSTALGKRVAQLREAAGLRQADLARRVTWSPAVLSRVEAGDRTLTSGELMDILDAIGTAEAEELKEIVSREWEQIPCPPLDHADQELLWEAETTAIALMREAEGDDIRPTFLKRLEEYRTDIKSVADLLLRREHNVAFIGAIGIGKSTAICKAAKLEVTTPDGQPAPVLETGGGGITLCEVSLNVGPSFGVIVTPRTSEEIRADVADFAELLLTRTEMAGRDESDESQRAVPRELERAIRNLSGLRPKRERDEDGRLVRNDPAGTLAEQLGSARELTVEILSRMDLPRRDRREAWYEESGKLGPLEWLKDVFEQINNGRHPEFSLPAHVDLIVPDLLDTKGLRVGLIDTRGIDRVTARADLEEHLLERHTVSILCSSFNDAPAQPIQHLLERSREIGNPQIDTHASILVLARPDEALAVKDEVGMRAETDEEGYDLKAEQVTAALTPLNMHNLAVSFFNSFKDDPGNLRKFVLARIEATREEFRAELRTVLANAQSLLDNVEMQQALEEQRAASHVIDTWLNKHVILPQVGSHIHDTLMAEIRIAHVSTLNAAVRREGEWYSLSYSYQLGFGARRLAVASLRDWLTEFKGISETLAESHPEAVELLNQGIRLMDRSYNELLKKMQVAGAALYQQELQGAQELWAGLAREWGRGPGYRDRVARRQRSWFGEEQQAKIEGEILRILQREWDSLRSRLSAIFDAE